MAIVTTEITFGGLPVVEARALIDEVARYNAENPDSPLPTDWQGHANAFRWTIGQAPGRGQVLMLAQHATQLSLGADQQLVFTTAAEQIALTGIVALRARKICGAAGDQNAVYAVDLSDRRHYARESAINDQFNVIAPEFWYYLRTLQPSVGVGVPPPFTWEDILEQLWNACPPLGPWPGLPGAIGQAEHARFPGENAYDILNRVLAHFGMAINPDFSEGTFTIVRLGDAQDAANVDAALARWQFYMLDSDPLENRAADVAETVEVYFHNLDWSYGHDVTMPTTQDSWQLKPTFSISVPTGLGSAGTKHIVWDDLRARYTPEGTLVNESHLQARAAVVAEAYVASRLQRLRRTYSGLAGGEFETSGALCGVAHHSHGDGLKTTVMRTPFPLHDPHMTCTAFYSAEGEVFAPPAIARPTIPFTRLAWVELSTPMAPYQCATGVVLARQFGGPAVFWVDCPAVGPPARHPWQRTKSVLNSIVDLTGATHQAREILFVAYHWQSGLWTVVHGGADPHFYAALLDRNGIRYYFEEVELLADCSWQFKVDGRRGFACQWNQQSHNSQGGAHPEIVEMKEVVLAIGGASIRSDVPERFAASGLIGDLSEKLYFFDYSVGPKELDSERYQYQLGDTWRRNNAPLGTKGVALGLVGVSLE